MAASDDANIQTLDTHIVYENRWLRLREDAIRRTDDSKGIYSVVEKPDFVVIVPVEADGRIHLVQQYRYPVRARYWEFPQGSWELAPDADPADIACGELREETGLRADHMVNTGHLFEAYGYSNQGSHVYLATGLHRGDADLDHEEQDLVSRAFLLAEVEQMIRDGEIKDGNHCRHLGPSTS
jgi:ADP-ribose pyrophosphatase